MKTIILVILIIISIFLSVNRKETLVTTNSIKTEKKVELNNSEIAIIYLLENNKYITKEIVVNNKFFLKYEDFIDLIFQETKFIKKNMEVLAVYKISEDQILIKLNEEFEKLPVDKIKILQKSIEKTLITNFKNLKSVIVQIDTNN